MTVPNANFTEILTTTIDNYSSTLADNVQTHNPLLRKVRERGNVRTFSGGVSILENLMYQENATFLWYSGLETLNVSGSDVLTSAQFDIKQANANVVVSCLEQLQNAGGEQIHNLTRARISNAEITLQNQIADALFFSNTEHAGKALGGLQHLVANDPTTGTVGGIDASANVFWRNQVVDRSSSDGANDNEKMRTAMNTAYINTTRGGDTIDMFVGDSTFFTFYLNALQANERFTSDAQAAAGFRSLKFWGGAADVFFDSSAPAQTMYGLNTKFIHFRPHANRNFTRDPQKMSVNQDAVVVPLYFAGNMTVSNRLLQAVIKE